MSTPYNSIETEIEDGFKYERLYNINMTLRQNDQVVASYRAEEMKTMINGVSAKEYRS